jgi:hypothetical protein
MERAIATFQAVIESNLFSPPAFENYSFDQKCANFQIFWDTQVPRFGEFNALGWKNSFLKGRKKKGDL